MPLIVMRLPPVASNLESTNPVAADTEPDEDSSPRDPSQALVRPTRLSLSGLSCAVGLSADRIQPMEPILKSS